MTTKKKPTKVTKPRAIISNERRLALALRAVLDQQTYDGENGTAETDAQTVLNELGYGSLVGIPKQIAQLEFQLATAVTDKDYPSIARLGRELERVKSGKVIRQPVAPAVKGKPQKKQQAAVVLPLDNGLDVEQQQAAAELLAGEV